MGVKRGQRVEVNSFVQGIVTDASSLNFPPNATRDEQNFEPNKDGSRSRRKGLLPENWDNDIIPYGINSIREQAIQSGSWKEVGGVNEKEFIFVQINQTVIFYDFNEDNSSPTKITTILLDRFPSGVKYSFTSLEGRLIVVAGVSDIAIISFENDVVSIDYSRLMIRDLFGVQETDNRYEEDESYRGANNPIHYYNLQNQSWGIPRRYTAEGVGTYVADPVQVYLSSNGKAPSNSEQVWPALQFQPVSSGQSPFERLFPNLWEEVIGAVTSSAKGYFIIDALNRGQSRLQAVLANREKYPELNTTGSYLRPREWGIVGEDEFGQPVYDWIPEEVIPGGVAPDSDFNPPEDKTMGGSTCVTEFAGRIFYAGFTGEVVGGDKRSPNFSNFVFFSKLVNSRQDFTKCYQDGDPTSRDSSDLVDTDGGFLKISEARGIFSLINLGSVLVVIATNGVWSITGGSDYGFTATNYKVTKLSTYGGISASSVIVEGSSAYFWADEGIYRIARNEFGDYEVKSISLGRLDVLYSEIPKIAKEGAMGVFDESNRTVRWLFNRGSLEVEELILDTAIGAFYKYKIFTDGGHTVLSPLKTPPFSSITTAHDVLAGNDPVLSNAVKVVSTIETSVVKATSVKYLCASILDSGSIRIGFGSFTQEAFKDWGLVDAKGFMLTGDVTAEDSAIRKQIPYVVIHMKRTDTVANNDYSSATPSGCLFRCQWAFSNAIYSNRWTPLRQAYRDKNSFIPDGPGMSFDNGFSIVTSKNKLRGYGPSFALYFETEEEKNCHIIGWNLTINANSIT